MNAYKITVQIPKEVTVVAENSIKAVKAAREIVERETGEKRVNVSDVAILVRGVQE